MAVAAHQGSSNLLVTLCGLPFDLVAHIFVFGDLGDVLHCAGSTCRALQHGIWQQPDFWVALGGPAFVEVLGSAAQSSMGVGPLRSSFRRWVFGIDAEWSQALEQHAACNPPAQTLRDFLDRIHGLHKEDASHEDICRLTRAATHAVQRLTALDFEGSDVAAALVTCCHTRKDLFCDAQLCELRTAVSSIQERVLQEKLLEEDDDDVIDPWCLSSHLPDADSNPPISSHSGKCLSLGFLAVMEESF